jgi:hypothetical protein
MKSYIDSKNRNLQVSFEHDLKNIVLINVKEVLNEAFGTHHCIHEQLP